MATIRQAKALLAQMQLSPDQRSQAEAEIAAAEAENLQIATGALDWSRARCLRVGAEAFDGAVQVAAEAQDLANDIRSGHIPAKEARQRYNQLTTNLGRAAKQRSIFETLTTSAAEIEADPAEWTDRLHEKFPATSPNFKFL